MHSPYNHLERSLDKNAILTITDIPFKKGGKWRFYYLGNHITATIKDSELMRIIADGERFGKGDELKVTLRVKQRYDTEARCYANVSYTVIAFHEHVIRDFKTGDIFKQE